MQVTLSTPSPSPLDQQVVPLGALLEHPFTNLAAFQALLSPRTPCEVLRVSHRGLYGRAEEPSQGKVPDSETSPILCIPGAQREPEHTRGGDGMGNSQ